MLEILQHIFTTLLCLGTHLCNISISGAGRHIFITLIHKETHPFNIVIQGDTSLKTTLLGDTKEKITSSSDLLCSIPLQFYSNTSLLKISKWWFSVSHVVLFKYYIKMFSFIFDPISLWIRYSFRHPSLKCLNRKPDI